MHERNGGLWQDFTEKLFSSWSSKIASWVTFQYFSPKNCLPSLRTFLKLGKMVIKLDWQWVHLPLTIIQSKNSSYYWNKIPLIPVIFVQFWKWSSPIVKNAWSDAKIRNFRWGNGMPLFSIGKAPFTGPEQRRKIRCNSVCI